MTEKKAPAKKKMQIPKPKKMELVGIEYSNEFKTLIVNIDDDKSRWIVRTPHEFDERDKEALEQEFLKQFKGEFEEE